MENEFDIEISEGLWTRDDKKIEYIVKELKGNIQFETENGPAYEWDEKTKLWKEINNEILSRLTAQLIEHWEDIRDTIETRIEVFKKLLMLCFKPSKLEKTYFRW